jgi:L-histidine N-alpha-methyltransferase
MQIDVHLEEARSLATMRKEVSEGLAGSPKTLPSKYFYDERGSLLFEEITRQPEYYLTRVEQSLLDDLSAEISRITQSQDLIELGAGSARKTRALIEAGRDEGDLRRYVPVEFSPEMAERAATELERRYPGLEVHAVIGDIEAHLEEIPEGRRPLVALLGSTIGNFDRSRAVKLLRQIRCELLENGGHLLLGTDLVKDKATLDAAYNDSKGVTARFNRNILNVINERLGGDFDADAFEHVAYFNSDEARIETYLRSRDDQSVRVEGLGLDVRFAAGEMMRTEISCKYTRESVEAILQAAGLELVRWFTDEEDRFALSLSRPAA